MTISTKAKHASIAVPRRTGILFFEGNGFFNHEAHEIHEDSFVIVIASEAKQSSLFF